MQTELADGKVSAPIEIPADVRASLVDSLYGEARSMFIGSAAASLGTLLTAWKTGEIWLYACAAAIAAVAVVRSLDMRAYARRRGEPTSLARLRAWELRYVTGASVYVGLLGLFCFIAFAMTEDAFARLISFGTVTAYLIGVSGRNFASDRLIVSQIACAGLPVIAGLVVAGGYHYALVVLVFLPLLVTMRFIAAGLRQTLLKAVINARNLAITARRFDTALNNMPHGLAMFDAEHRLVVRNGRLHDLLRIPEADLAEGANAAAVVARCVATGLVEGASRAAFAAAMLPGRDDGHEEAVIETGDGRSLSLAVRRMADGGWVTIVQDVTERSAAERKINHLASFDTLTELPNRNALRFRMEKIAETGEASPAHALLFVDLDRFKQVNDTLGHRMGDALLVAVAERLCRFGGPDCPVARFGGDEFILLVADGDAEQAAAIARQVIAELSEPYQIDHHKVVIGASIGIALCERGAFDPDQLLRDADTALYEAKTDGRGRYCFFRPDMATRAATRRTLEMDLRQAVENGGFRLVYQPLYDVHGRRYSTCEALLRWDHPERGPVSPADFIPIAEETGLIVPIGRWVLVEACRECLLWPDERRVAVNISSVQFQYDDVAGAIREALRETGLPADRLDIEITESALLKEEAGTLAALERIRELGVHISLDDFGTGYSSLSYLRSFRFSKVKVDRSFIRGLASDATSRTLLRGIARLSSELGMRVTVEGIETDEQMRLLASFAFIDEIQGYYFSRPVGPVEIRDLLRRDRTAAGTASGATA